jgi:selenide,water dikinase
VYSLHEPGVLCIGKGKERKKYEFGSKSGLVITKQGGILVGAKIFSRNVYDGDTLDALLPQVASIIGSAPETAFCDRGFRGRPQEGTTHKGWKTMISSSGLTSSCSFSTCGPQPDDGSPPRLVDMAKAAGCAAKIGPGDLERILRQLPADPWAKGRLLTASGRHEDAAIVRVPAGKALVQTLDFFTPIVNDPYRYGQIAAANALSDVYAMGGEPWCAMNIVCFPAKKLDMAVLSAILRGGADKVAEAGAAMAGGHSVEDGEIKFGLSVTGLVDPAAFADNASLADGDILLLTKSLGTGILATAVKARWPGHEEFEEILYNNAARLNIVPAGVVRTLGLKAATDVTGFGLGGHLLEMLEASDKSAVIHAGRLSLLSHTLELASMGLVPAGSHANRAYRQNAYTAAPEVDPLRLDLIFDAQTSGGMLLAVPPEKLEAAVSLLTNGGESFSLLGEIHPSVPGSPRLDIQA